MPQHRTTTRAATERRSHLDAGLSESSKASTSGGRERRAARRVTLRAPLSVRWAGEEEFAKLRILDISRTGFRFECSRIYTIGNHGHADSIKPEGTRIESDFVVVWTREIKAGVYQYGARFVKSASLRRSA
jgi:hypothetical protein